MGYDQHQQSSSSGALVGVVVAVLLIAVLGIVAVVGAGLLMWQDFDGLPQAAVLEQPAVVELQDSEVIQVDGMAQIQQSSVAATPDPRLSYELKLDRDGNAGVDGEEIGLDELRAQLAKLKDETSNTFSVHINADSECPVKHIVPVLDVCREVGDIDFRIVSSRASGSSDESHSEN